MILGLNMQDTIINVIALGTLYNNFDMTTTSLLEIENKIIDQIQSILQLEKAKNICKCTTWAIGDLVILYKDNNNNQKIKYKANSNKKYFNCHAYSYYGQNYSYYNQ